MNNLAISLKKFFTNKNTVTIIGVIAILVILYFLYTSTVNNATEMIRVPVAAQAIEPQTEITAEDVTYIEIANAAKPDSVIMNANQIIGKYTGIGSTIPEGSMFYEGVVVEKEDLPGHWLTLIEPDALGNPQIPYYFSVNVTTTFQNGIMPDTYVDFYVRTYDEQNQLMFGKLLSNVKVLAVTDSEGKNVFSSQQNIGTPAFLNFGIQQELYDVIKKAEYANNIDIELIVVPHGGKVAEEDLSVNVSSEYLRDYILAHAVILPENPTTEQDANANGTTPTNPANPAQPTS